MWYWVRDGAISMNLCLALYIFVIIDMCVSTR